MSQRNWVVVSYIYIFSAVAFFMLLIACINYMNLTTARSARRGKEIGIRKVTGSSRLQLITQFLVESTMTALFALALSLGMIALLLPTFNTLSGKSISFGYTISTGYYGNVARCHCFCWFGRWKLPRIFIYRISIPCGVLKGSLSKGSGNVVLRRALVVFSFPFR
jgi:putative ABC transport system permease protein